MRGLAAIPPAIMKYPRAPEKGFGARRARTDSQALRHLPQRRQRMRRVPAQQRIDQFASIRPACTANAWLRATTRWPLSIAIACMTSAR